MNLTTDHQLFQFLIISIFFLLFCLINRQKIAPFFYLISFPFLFYFPLNFSVLILILLYSTAVYQIIFSTQKTYPLLAGLIVITALIFLKTDSPYFSPNINIIDHQRGFHPNWQTSLSAKLLHNKLFLSYQFLDNLVNHLSLSRIFASGLYPNFAKYVPIGYLFPFDLFTIFFTLKSLRLKLLRLPIIIFLTLNLLGIALYQGLLANFFLGSFIVFLALLVTHTLNRFPSKIALALVTLNVLTLAFINPLINLFWDIGFKL